MNEKISRMKYKLKKYLDAPRYEHTMGVMYTAAAMAMRYDVDVEQALIAGLLHDCAKCIPADVKIRLCSQYGVSVSEVELKNISLLHAKLGAYIAAKKYHVEDKEILCAIASHTTGRPGMTVLDKIIYIADYIEPGRQELPNMKEVRRLAFTELDECLYRILKDSLNYLKTKEIPIDPMTENTYKYYKEKLKKEVM